jgi:hypothetical protein
VRRTGSRVSRQPLRNVYRLTVPRIRSGKIAAMDPQRTIRDEITRSAGSQKWLAALPAAIAVSAAGVGMFVATMRRRGVGGLPPGLVIALALGVMLVVVLMGLIITSRRARGSQCPKCGSQLSLFAYLMKDTPRMKKINFCPFCGVNLDSPMPDVPPPSENVTTPDKLVWK